MITKENRKTTTRIYRNYNWLSTRYTEMSTTQIAEVCGTTHATVRYWLNKHGISTRTCGEGVHLRNGHRLERFPLELHQFLDGSLLGDGCLEHCRTPSARYKQKSKLKNYVAWIRSQFAQWGIEVSTPRLVTNTGDGVRNCLFSLTYAISSKSYADFKTEYKRWYPKGTKIVPRDLQLSPLLVLKWMLDDGCRYPDHVVLCTNGFAKADVLFLQEKLDGIDIPTSLWETKRGADQWMIAINRPGYDAFFDYIGRQAPIPEMAYKFPKENRR